MVDTTQVITSLIERYSAAVNANNSTMYAELFADDAIRVPPGSDPEYGPNQIAKGEQADYEAAKWSTDMQLVDALPINEEWIYALVHVDAKLQFYTDGSEAEKDATKGFLIQRQANDDWLIKRYLWNLK